MKYKKSFILYLFLSFLNFVAAGQSRELINLLNTGSCTTCQVGSNCQPNPLAGSIGNTDLGYTIEDVWGNKRVEIINGRTFFFFNMDETQRQLVIDALEILPLEYIEMLPANFRVGNPNRPYSLASAGRQIGGSKFCTPYREENLQYESIVLHADIFTINNKRHRTILHECGHFFSRKFDVVGRMNPDQISHSSNYLTTEYHGLTSSHDETIAQSFMFFFHQMYFEGNNKLVTPKTFDQIVPLPVRKFPRWMCDFIKPIIQDTSSF